MNRRGFISAIAGLSISRFMPAIPTAVMAAPITYSLNLSDIITATLRKHAPQIRANITQRNELLRKLSQRPIVS